MFALMRDFNDDPMFSGPMESMRRMESMMDGMMSPFGLFGGSRTPQGAHPHQGMLMPFGFGGSLFPSMDDMMLNMSHMAGNPSNCHSFSSSSMMTYTTDESGRPQVYQESSSMRNMGGVKETRRSVQDSRSGLQQLSIGHHLDERGHVIEKKKNRYTGEAEENEEFINLEDDDADRFNREWQERAQAYHSRPVRSMLGYEEPIRSPRQELLAITEGTSNSEQPRKKPHKQRRHGHKPAHSRSTPYQ